MIKNGWQFGFCSSYSCRNTQASSKAGSRPRVYIVGGWHTVYVLAALDPAVVLSSLLTAVLTKIDYCCSPKIDTEDRLLLLTEDRLLLLTEDRLLLLTEDRLLLLTEDRLLLLTEDRLLLLIEDRLLLLTRPPADLCQVSKPQKLLEEYQTLSLVRGWGLGSRLTIQVYIAS